MKSLRMWAKLEQQTAYEELQKQKESENKYAEKGEQLTDNQTINKGNVILILSCLY